MRFLGFITFLMFVLMMVAGISNFTARKAGGRDGISFTEQFSLANVIYSQPVCIDMYVEETQPRAFDCNIGKDATSMVDISFFGIVPSNATYYQNGACGNLSKFEHYEGSYQ